MTDSAPPPQIFFDPMKKFTPPLPNSTTDLLLSQVLHHLKCCNTAAILDLMAAPKVKIESEAEWAVQACTAHLATIPFHFRC